MRRLTLSIAPKKYIRKKTVFTPQPGRRAAELALAGIGASPGGGGRRLIENMNENEQIFFLYVFVVVVSRSFTLLFMQPHKLHKLPQLVQVFTYFSDKNQQIFPCSDRTDMGVPGRPDMNMNKCVPKG